MLCSKSTNYNFLLPPHFLFILHYSKNVTRLTRPPNLRSADMLSCTSATAQFIAVLNNPLLGINPTLPVQSSVCINVLCYIRCYKNLCNFYVRSHYCEKRLLAPSCLSVGLHGTTRLPLDGSS
jgi:hypothetical protein